MPSKRRGEELGGIIKRIWDGTFEYESKEPVKTNGSQYDQAQIYEMANYLDNIRDLVDEADKRQKQNSKKDRKKSKSSSKEQADDSFSESNSVAKRGFSYSVMGVGVQYKLISGISISQDHSIGETTLFPDAFGQTLCCHPNLKNVLGDGIYWCRGITDLVSGNHATPYFLPRSNVTFKSKGAAGWYDMLFSLWKDPQGWLEDYHMHSISETVNSMVKCRFGAPLRKRLDSRKETETRLKLVAHDIRRVWYLGSWATWRHIGVGRDVRDFCPKATYHE